MKVIEIAKKLKQISLTNRGFCVMALLDIKNAFNTVSWNVVKKSMREMQINRAITRIMASYLSDRFIVLPGGQEKRICAGVAQGSVIGGTIWNINYDQILKLELEKGETIVAYADDLEVLVSGKRENEIIDKMEYAIVQISEKTERDENRTGYTKDQGNNIRRKKENEEH